MGGSDPGRQEQSRPSNLAPTTSTDTAARAAQQRMSASDFEAMVDSLGDMTAVLGRAGSGKHAILYRTLPVDLRCRHAERAVHVEANPRILGV